MERGSRRLEGDIRRGYIYVFVGEFHESFATYLFSNRCKKFVKKTFRKGIGGVAITIKLSIGQN